jgi:aspartyl/asparaginyl beta-hydroxylase (cupin superfamily)
LTVPFLKHSVIWRDTLACPPRTPSTDVWSDKMSFEGPNGGNPTNGNGQPLLGSNDTSRVQIIVTCITCLVAASILRWLHSRRHPSSSSSSSTVKINSGDNGCNDPNCIRCHSMSTTHIKKFQRNATLLRRLVKLEPEMFEGMREDVWRAVEEMEQLMTHGHITAKSKKQPKPTQSSTDGIPPSPQPGQDPTVFFLPNLAALPFHHVPCIKDCPCARLWTTIPPHKHSPPITLTGDIEALRTNYAVIKRELMSVMSSSEDLFTTFDSAVYNQVHNINSQQPEWSSIYLYHQGIQQSEMCNKYFPQTTNILETKCPHRMAGKCGLGSVYFSKLKNNTKVKEHCGPTNVRWRCHLPLFVPQSSKSYLFVGLAGVNEERISWKEGVPILFDDSFVHSAEHNTDNSTVGDERIVLIVDLWHPSLSDADRTAIGVLYPPGY